MGTLHLHDNFPLHARNPKLYIWLECPEGPLVVWGDVLILKNKLLIIIKRFLFTASKNINHNPSYEQSKYRTYKSLNHHNTLPYHTAYARLIKLSITTRARASYYVPLNDHFIDHYTHHTLHTSSLLRLQLYRHNLHVGTLISITTISWQTTQNPKLYIWWCKSSVFCLRCRLPVVVAKQFIFHF